MAAKPVKSPIVPSTLAGRDGTIKAGPLKMGGSDLSVPVLGYVLVVLCPNGIRCLLAGALERLRVNLPLSGIG